MSYEERFQLVRASLIKYCKECVSENWERMFDMWLSCEADMEFGHGYQDKFKEQFGDYITDEIKSQLWFAGKNIIYAINTFIKMKKGSCKLNDILKFVEHFVSEQLNDFDNDYDTTGWFNNETENEEELQDDNPQ
jgi:hypothetical protein